MREILKTSEIAKATGYSSKQVLFNIKNGIWNFGRIVNIGKKKSVRATVSEVAKYLDISREEIIRRVEEN